jgi:hypothetical protein
MAVDGQNFPAPALPPGVYQASSDHLSHALMNAGRYHPVAAGCPTEYVVARSGPYEPLFFSKAEFAVIRRLTELLLGVEPDETAEWIDLKVYSAAGVRAAAGRLEPLHRALAVAYYGAERVEKLATEDPAQICRAGLKWLGQREFMTLGTNEQVALLHAMSEERADKTETDGTRLFTFLKAEAIRGFYTSQAGLKEIDFKGNAFHARSPGCPA